MKKLITFMLLCAIAIVLVGCKEPVSEQPTVENKYAIGKTGPGGGTIYYYDSATGVGKEVSGSLAGVGGVEWEEAKGIVASYNVDGIAKWTFPTLDDLEELYTAKVAYGILQDENSYLWSSTEDTPDVSAWVYNFGSGYLYSEGYQRNEMDEITTNGLRAIRTFNTSSL